MRLISFKLKSMTMSGPMWQHKMYSQLTNMWKQSFQAYFDDAKDSSQESRLKQVSRIKESFNQEIKIQVKFQEKTQDMQELQEIKIQVKIQEKTQDMQELQEKHQENYKKKIKRKD